MRNMTESAVPGAYLVDAFPLLKYIPSWMPGARFKRVAEMTNVLMDELVKVPFDEMLSKIVRRIHFLVPFLIHRPELRRGWRPIHCIGTIQKPAKS